MGQIKIAFIIGSLASGGAEKVCVTLSNYFVSHGMNVTIYIKNEARKSIYELDERIVVKEVCYPRAKRKKWKIILSGWLYMRSLTLMLREDNPNILISFGTGLNLSTILISKWIKKPIIVSEHINHNLSDKTTIEKLQLFFTRRFLYRVADVVTVLTQYDYEYYRKFLKNVIVMHNPILVEETKSNIERRNLVLAVGSYDSYYIKGFDRLIQLFPYEKSKDWTFAIAGKGDKRLLETLNTKQNHLNEVKLLGEVKNMKELYGNASVFALSSRTEGLPVALLEAMSHGCACISFNCISGPAEIIDHGINGYLVEDGDLEGFKLGLIELMENPQLRAAFGEAAMEKSKNFSIDTLGGNWIQIIEQVLRKSKLYLA